MKVLVQSQPVNFVDNVITTPIQLYDKATTKPQQKIWSDTFYKIRLKLCPISLLSYFMSVYSNKKIVLMVVNWLCGQVISLSIAWTKMTLMTLPDWKHQRCILFHHMLLMHYYLALFWNNRNFAIIYELNPLIFCCRSNSIRFQDHKTV